MTDGKDCPRCKGSGTDPEDATGASPDDWYGPGTPVLEPCRGCQFPGARAPREREDSAWGSVWLYGNWREITRQMPTEERELAADAVARWSERTRLAQDYGEPAGLRWWRDAADYWRGHVLPEDAARRA